MMGFVQKGVETGAAIAGSRVLANVRRGKLKKALLWSVPMAAAALLVWRIRK